VPDPAPSPAELRAAAQVFVDDLDTLTLDVEDEHHLTRVLRLRPGEIVVASDGRGGWRPCRFSAGSTLEPDGETIRLAAPRPPVIIGLVVAKGSRPEWAVQKLTEVGVDEVVLLRSARSVVRWEGERSARALARLRRVARSAAAQSRRPWLPTVAGVETVDGLARRLAPVPLAVAAPGGMPPDLEHPALVVGPEGGWDGADPVGELPTVGLGDGVLRSETAAVAGGLLLCSLRQGVVDHARERTSR
jgi:16S rRNA (uracil1498-N3)-methyltransferase